MADAAEKARTLEGKLDWRGAARFWDQARLQGHDGATEGLDRCRRAEAVIDELCAVAEEDIAERELAAATEPLEAAMEVGGAEHPRILPVKKQWIRLRRGLLKGRGKAKLIAGAIALLIMLGTLVLGWWANLSDNLIYVLSVLAPLVAGTALYSLMPSLRRHPARHVRLRSPPKKPLKAPAMKAREKARKSRYRASVKVPQAPRPTRSRALEQWRKSAAAENRDWWHNI